MTYGGVDVKMHVFLTSALDGGEWSASRIPGIHSIGGCGLQSQSARYVKVKFFYSTRTRTWTPFSSSLQPVAIPTALPRLFVNTLYFL
jgi:hypothetical protein